MTDYERALLAMDALRNATWFAEYLEKRFSEVRANERERCAQLAEAVGECTLADRIRKK